MGDVESDYDIGEVIGTGNFSQVHIATHTETGDKVAIKVIEKGSIDASRLETEIEILKRVEHPSIIQLIGIYESSNKLYLVMELVTGGELFDKIVEIGSYSEGTARAMVRQIVGAVKYLHQNGIAHRDLKPTNLLLKSADCNDIKIADFGLSKILGPDTMMQTACGTPIYVAPEVLRGEGYGEEVDMWSVGVIMYIMLCGFPPFYDDGDNMGQLFEQIMEGDFDFPDPYWTDISDAAQDLIENLLVVEVEDRFTADQALGHEWLTGEEDLDADLSAVRTHMSDLKTKGRI